MKQKTFTFLTSTESTDFLQSFSTLFFPNIYVSVQGWTGRTIIIISSISQLSTLTHYLPNWILKPYIYTLLKDRGLNWH